MIFIKWFLYQTTKFLEEYRIEYLHNNGARRNFLRVITNHKE